MSPREISKAISHLKLDPAFAPYIAKLPRPVFTNHGTPFESLVRSIIYQQLSGKAAGTILKRFHTLFRANTPTPRTVLKVTDAQFKSCGISGQKMGYLRDLAAKFIDKTIDPTYFHEMTDDAIRTHLIAVKGIGRWTADMFLMFTLHRPDVLPTGDLAIQKAIQRVYKLRKKPDVKKMEKIALRWQPYRTIASWYLWRTADTGEGDW